MGSPLEYSLHANVHQHDQDLSIRVSLTGYDSYGGEAHTSTWRGREQNLPELETEVDTAWLLALMITRMLEKNGSVGRVSAVVEPPLF